MNSKEKAYMKRKYYWAVFKDKVMELSFKDQREGNIPVIDEPDLSCFGDKEISDFKEVIIIRGFIEGFAKAVDLNNQYLEKIRIMAEKDAMESYKFHQSDWSKHYGYK